MQTVYLWNAGNGEINELCRADNAEEYVCSVSWVDNGSALAIGYSDATVQLWDVTRQKRVRTLHGHDSRVAALAWNGPVLSSGCKTGDIFNHDVRIADHHIATMAGHTQEVCGLKWSPDGRSLARSVPLHLISMLMFIDVCIAVAVTTILSTFGMRMEPRPTPSTSTKVP